MAFWKLTVTAALALSTLSASGIMLLFWRHIIKEKKPGCLCRRGALRFAPTPTVSQLGLVLVVVAPQIRWLRLKPRMLVHVLTFLLLSQVLPSSSRRCWVLRSTLEVHRLRPCPRRCTCPPLWLRRPRTSSERPRTSPPLLAHSKLSLSVRGWLLASRRRRCRWYLHVSEWPLYLRQVHSGKRSVSLRKDYSNKTD